MFRRISSDERGVTTVMVVGIMSLLLIFSAGVFYFAYHDLERSRDERLSSRAFQIADAGIVKTLWMLRATGTLPGEGKFKVEVEKNGTATIQSSVGDFSWSFDITSVGVYMTPEGEISKRAIKVNAFALSIWQMNLSLGSQSLPVGGNGINGTTSVYGPFYVKGNLPLSGTCTIQEGPLMVKNGELSFQSNSALVGYSPPETSRVTVFAEYGCFDQRGAKKIPITSFTYPDTGQKILWAAYNSNYSSAPNIDLPVMQEFSFYRQTASNESYDYSEPEDDQFVEPDPSGGVWVRGYPDGDIDEYKIIDGDGDSDSDTPITFSSALPSFGLKYNDGSAVNLNTVNFAWDSTGGVLYVRGTVFIDGNVTFNGAGYTDNRIQYKGNGTLVVNGDIILDNGLIPYNKQITSDNVLGVITNDDLTVTFSGKNASPSRSDPDFAGAFFVGDIAKFERNNIVFVGSIVSGLLDFTSASNCHLFTHPQLPNYLPPNLPGADERMVSISNWHEVKPPKVIPTASL